MASNSNLWVTPPSMNKNFTKFVEVSDEALKTDSISSTFSFQSTRRWFESLCKFHEDRALEVLHIPEEISMTKEAIETFLSLDIRDLCIPTKANSVHLIPLHPETLDPLLGKWKLDDNRPTKYRFSSSEKFLCVGRLPIDMDQEKFIQLVSKFGTINRAFLIFDHRSDQSTGLGLVEFCSREVAFQARNLLHENNGLFCDWLDHRLVTYNCLYPKCLLAPEAALKGRDPRETFSCMAMPRYCQVVPSCGIVLAEFATSEEASSTCKSLRDSGIEVHLANPGKNALKLYEKFLSDLLDSRKSERNSKFPLWPLGGQSQTFMDDHLNPQDNYFPALPLSNPTPTASILGTTQVPSLNNAFHFPLACSPLRHLKQQVPSNQSLPALHTAFSFGLPCSPVLKILGPLQSSFGTQSNLIQASKSLDPTSSRHPLLEVSPEVSQEGDVSLTLATPPAWKEFTLRSFSLTPEDSITDPTQSIVRGIREAVLSSGSVARSRPQPCKRLLVPDEDYPHPSKTQKHHPLSELGNNQAWLGKVDQSQKATWAKWDLSCLETIPVDEQDENIAVPN